MWQHVPHVTGVCENKSSCHSPPSPPWRPPSPNNNVDVAFLGASQRCETKKCLFLFARDLLLAPNIVSGGRRGAEGLQTPAAQ